MTDSPRKLWLKAGGDRDKYIQLMIDHGHIVVEPAPESHVDTIVEKSVAEQNAPLCVICRNLVVLTEKDFVKVHFAKVEDMRPCPGSYKAWTG